MEEQNNTEEATCENYLTALGYTVNPPRTISEWNACIGVHLMKSTRDKKREFTDLTRGSGARCIGVPWYDTTYREGYLEALEGALERTNNQAYASELTRKIANVRRSIEQSLADPQAQKRREQAKEWRKELGV